MRENIGISSMYTHILANICFKFYYHNTLKFKHLHCNIILYTSGSKKRLQELGHPKVFFFSTNLTSKLELLEANNSLPEAESIRDGVSILGNNSCAYIGKL